MLDELAAKVDEPARDIVDKLIARPKKTDPNALSWDERNQLFPAVVGKISDGTERVVSDFLADGELIDDFIDLELIRHAQAFFEENGISIITALFHAALPEAYLGKRGVQVLGMTGELVSNWTRRIQLTGQLLVTVLSPDPDLAPNQTTLHPGQVAATAVRRVRLRHAAVRWILEAPYEPPFTPLYIDAANPPTVWELRMAQIGEDKCPSRPLNQEDLLGTLGTFTSATFDALAKMGVAFDDDDRKAYFHLWNVVGWHLGIGDRVSLGDEFDAGAGRPTWPDNMIFPLAPPELDDVFARLRQRLQGTSEEGVRLAKTLVQEMSRPLPGPLQGAPAFLVRYLIGDVLANELEIDAGGYVQLFVRHSRALEGIAKWLRVNAFGEVMVSALSSAITRYALRAFITESRGIDPAFSIDPGIANRWGIQTGPEVRQPLSR
jgi:hypothetical protein